MINLLKTLFGRNKRLQLVADNRRLRAALKDLIKLINIVDIRKADRKEALEIINAVLMAAKPVDEHRALLSLEVVPGQSRAQLEASVARMLDSYFGKDHKGTKVVDRVAVPAEPLARYHAKMGPVTDTVKRGARFGGGDNAAG